MPGESLSFPIIAEDRASRQFREVGRAAEGAAVKMDLAAASAKLWNDTTVKSGKANDNLIASKLAVAKADRALADAENFVGAESAKATRLMSGQSRTFNDTGKSAEKAATQFSLLAGTGGAGGGGMGALIGAGVALSPIIATVGVGLLGFGAAAYGAAAPILKAAKATGGLSANMAKLNPEQQKVAVGLLGLGQQFHAFEKALEPQVLSVFNQGISLAGHLLRDVQPVAKATGTALDSVLASIDQEFASGTWQQFFAFMARTAAPDIRLLGQTFTDLLQVLPGLLIDLQPLATGILRVGDDAVRAAGGVVKFYDAFQRDVPISNLHIGNAAKEADRWVTSLTNKIPGAKAVNNWITGLQQALTGTGSAGQGAAAGLGAAAHGAVVAGPKFFDLTGAVNKLNTSMTTLVGNLLTLQGENVSWRQSMQAAKKQLDSNTAGLAGNSKNALANRAAVIQSSQAALTFAGDQLKLGGDIGAASRTVQAQIRWLQSLHSNSATVRAEIRALRLEEQKLQAQRINQRINVQGLGQWSVSQSLAPGAGHRRARGGLIPGAGSGDSYPALLTPGEVVVPKPMVSAGAVDHLRGRLPGFAAGGIVPSYSGSVGGMPRWVQANDAATVRLIDVAVAKATLAGIRAAQSAASASAFRDSGARSGNAALAQAYAASLLAAYGWGSSQMAPLISLWNQESGWNAYAVNPTSGAYGIPQSLGHGHPYNLGDYKAQVAWGLQYIKSAYGSPAGAWGHEMAFNWYDRGGWLPPGVSMAVNTTGRPERVGGGGEGAPVVMEIHAGPAQVDQLLLEILRKSIRVRGGNVQVVLGR